MINYFKKIDFKKVFLSFYWLLIALVLLDQGLKILFLNLEANYGPYYDVTVIPNFFYFSYHRNTGAAWSIFEDYPFILAIISFVAVSAMLAYRIIKRKKLTTLHKALWAVIIAGTAGNLIDRAFYQLLTGTPGVVDFIHFRFGTYDFPIFNIADMCLVLGMISLMVLTFIEDNKQAKEAAKSNQKTETIEATNEEKTNDKN